MSLARKFRRARNRRYSPSLFTSSSSDSPRRTKRSRKGSDPAFDDDDEEYCPPNLPNLPNLPVLGEDREESVPGSDRTKVLDPFDFFEDGIVHIIITKLDAADTETLRRVCKMWKATSEAHCGRNALRRHFPVAAFSLRDDEQGSVEEENLRFRRYLYHHQCLRLGHATRAIRFTGAITWDLKNHTLLWGDTSGDVFIRTLRTAGISPHAPVYVADEVINLRQFPISFSNISRVWLLEGGELIVQLGLRADHEVPADIGRARLLRINKTGSVLWEIACRAGWWSMAAIGQTGVYFVTENGVHGTPKLIEFSIQNGLALSDYASNGEEGGFKKTNQAPDALILASHEKFAVWRDVDSLITVFSTSSREIMFQCVSQPENQIVTSVFDPGIWSIHPYMQLPPPTLDLTSADVTDPEVQDFLLEGSYFASCKESSTDCMLKPIHFPWEVQREDLEWAFDGDSGILFMAAPNLLPMRIVEERPQLWPPSIFEYTDPFAKVMIAAVHRLPPLIPNHIHFKYKWGPVEVSLPPSRQQPGQRRPLEIEVQFDWSDRWFTKRGDCFRMVENYLIHHSHEGSMLHIIDFWPTW